MSAGPDVAAFHDERTGSVQYIVSDAATRQCAIIDPVLDFDEKSGAVKTANADRILDHIRRERLDPVWVLDTHPHADHFSAAHYLHKRTGAPIGTGVHVVAVQKLWKAIYNWPGLATDGSQWNRLFSEGERFAIGETEVAVMHSPGHTLASVTFVAGDAAFVHDTFFMPDSGTARCDFPGGSAAAMWRTLQAILSLPGGTRVFTGHDYRPGGRETRWESTVAEQRDANTHIAACGSETDYVALREARDRTLPMPRLILHALQVNINGGRLPEPEDNGLRYLRFPLGALPGAAW